MGQQILVIQDDDGNVYNLGETDVEGKVGVRTSDHPVFSVLDNRFGAVVGTAVAISQAGNTDLVAPTSGKSIKLNWIALATSETNTSEVIVQVYLGAQLLYEWPLGAPGAFAHSSVRIGAPNAKLRVFTSNAQTVRVNYEYEEV